MHNGKKERVIMSKPARLHKKEPEDDIYSFYNSMLSMVEAWVISHATLCLIVAMCLLMALFVTLIFVTTGVSATESGVTYNHLESMV